jgi:hypothetical protein
LKSFLPELKIASLPEVITRLGHDNYNVDSASPSVMSSLFPLKRLNFFQGYLEGSKALPFAAGILWITAVGIGMWSLMAFDTTPGGSGLTSATWPSGTSTVFHAGRINLVMFAHPNCPCTRASLGELGEIMVRSKGLISARVLFYQPTKRPADWGKDDLSGLARALPQVTVQDDIDGMEAARFGATTSGYTVVYDVYGKLQFRGGITRARGQVGASAGRQIILSLLNQTQVTEGEAPVFGCALTASRAVHRD